jgi:hypothetical protein
MQHADPNKAEPSRIDRGPRDHGVPRRITQTAYVLPICYDSPTASERAEQGDDGDSNGGGDHDALAGDSWRRLWCECESDHKHRWGLQRP